MEVHSRGSAQKGHDSRGWNSEGHSGERWKWRYLRLTFGAVGGAGSPLKYGGSPCLTAAAALTTLRSRRLTRAAVEAL